MELSEINVAEAELEQNVVLCSRITRALSRHAASAIAGLWDPTRKTFWRSTEHRAAEIHSAAEDAFFPTVTFRSIEALLRLIDERPTWADASTTDLVLKHAVPALLAREEKDMQSSLGVSSEGGVLNPFTLSLYIDCLSRVCRCTLIDAGLIACARLKLNGACVHVLSYSTAAKLESSQGGAIVHPLVLFHLMRAIEAAIPILEGETCESLGHFRDSLAVILKQQVKSLLAQDGLGVMNPGEGVAIAFCTAALAASRDQEKIRFLQAALKVAFKFQDSSGCWPLGRIVRENQDSEVKRDLQIPTYEIAWAVAEAVSSIVASNGDFLEDDSTSAHFSRLVRSAAYTAASVVHLEATQEPNRGWCSEHAFGKPTIESWTSATVLQSLLSLSELTQSIDRHVVLRCFASASPMDAGWPEWQRWPRYRLEAEPERDVHVLEYLDRTIVSSISANPQRLPQSGKKNVSMLLFGPPGTAKTTIVKALADGLNWPIVFLSPGNFIERGLEYIEAEAKSVFDRLQRLSRVVVLFDECDELFRDRKPVAGMDQVRSITAFVTASMLPKLQDLHDRGRVVFAICTNHLESMDPAIKRGGRIDHLIGIGPPDRESRRKIIEQVLSHATSSAHIAQGIDELASSTDRFTRVEIERASSLFCRQHDSEDEARTAARRIADEMKPSLTISMEEFESFNRQKREFSHPHIEREIR